MIRKLVTGWVRQRAISWHRKLPTGLKQTGLLVSSKQRNEIRELVRLAKLPAGANGVTSIFGRQFHFVDAPSFLSAYSQIWQRGAYQFAASQSDPLIIDGGANIGLSVHYFKQQYPDARVVAFEPDPAIFAVLERNAKSCGWSRVELVEAALWDEGGRMLFHQRCGDAGRLVRFERTGTIPVRTVRLRELLGSERIAMLKLDIEGAEHEVLADCADVLSNVDNAFVEYHSFADRPQQLSRVAELLGAAGFRLQIESAGVPARPLIHRREYLGMDMQLNIFGYRP